MLTTATTARDFQAANMDLQDILKLTFYLVARWMRQGGEN